MGWLESVMNVYNIHRQNRKAAQRRGPVAFLSPWQYNQEYSAMTDYAAMIAAYKSWVYVCATKNSGAVAQGTLRLYATKGKGQKFIVPSKIITREKLLYLQQKSGLYSWLNKEADVEEILEHPFLDLKRNVNPFSNQFDLFDSTETFLELTGNAYWYLVLGSLGTPEEIWVMPSQNMKIVPSKETFIKGYVYSLGMEKVPYEEKEIVHFKFSNPANQYYGMGPLQAAASAYVLNSKMSTYETAFFANMARPEGVLETDQEVGDEAYTRIMDEWYDSYGGAEKQGKTALLDKGLKYKPITLSPREMSYLSGRAWTRDEIGAIFGVPKSKLTSDDVNLANSKEGNESYMRDTILPRMCRIEDKINEKIMPLYAENLFVAFDNPVPEDNDARIKERESNLKTFYSSINIERQRDGQEPVPWGDVPLVQMGIAPLGSAPPAGANGEALQPDEEPKAIKSTHDIRRDKWLKFAKVTTPLEDMFKTAVAKLFNEQEKEVLNNIKNNPSGKITDWLFNKKKWEGIFAEVGEPLHIKTLIAGAAHAESELPAKSAKSKAFDATSPVVLAYLKTKLFKFSFETNTTTEDQLRQSMAEGVEAGETMFQVSARVKNVFLFAQEYRNDRIARTEVIGSFNFGAQDRYKEAGVEKQEWIATMDDRTRDSHAALDGVVREIGKTFDNGLKFPGDPNGAPGEIINCRCTIGPVTE